MTTKAVKLFSESSDVITSLISTGTVNCMTIYLSRVDSHSKRLIKRLTFCGEFTFDSILEKLLIS